MTAGGGGRGSAPATRRHYFASVDPVTEPGDDDLITILELCAMLRISRATFYRCVAKGVMPLRPVPRIGNPRYRLGDVRAHLRRKSPGLMVGRQGARPQRGRGHHGPSVVPAQASAPREMAGEEQGEGTTP